MPKSTRTENWSKNQHCVPERVVDASTVRDIADAIRRAAQDGGRVKAIGAGHSFTGAAMTDGTLLRLGELDRLERYDVDTGVATVGAGITLHDLSRQLDERGRALPNLGDIDVQTAAGATSTATHGTGLALGNIATGIVGFELVTGNGDILWCDSDANAELFRVGRVSIGALGIITRLALDTVPAFNLEASEGPEPVDAIIENWDEFTRSADHAEFFWLPGESTAFTKRNRRTTDAAQPRSRARYIAEKVVLENAAFGVSQRLVRRFPGTRDRVAKTMMSALAPSTHVDKSYAVFASPRRVKFMETEFGVPIDAIPEAFARVAKLAESLDLPPTFPVEVRCSAGDDIPLSTAYGRDTGWIAVHQYLGMPYGDYFRGVATIAADYGGRPHWGKHHDLSAAELAGLYPEWEAFQATRGDHDPGGVFANTYLDRILGPVQSRT